MWWFRFLEVGLRFRGLCFEQRKLRTRFGQSPQSELQKWKTERQNRMTREPNQVCHYSMELAYCVPQTIRCWTCVSQWPPPCAQPAWP